MPDSVRHLHSLQENMGRYHAEILQIVDRARIVCNENAENEYHCPLGPDCPFRIEHDRTPCKCKLLTMLEMLKKEG